MTSLARWLELNRLAVSYTGTYWTLHHKHSLASVHDVGGKGFNGPSLDYLVAEIKKHKYLIRRHSVMYPRS